MSTQSQQNMKEIFPLMDMDSSAKHRKRHIKLSDIFGATSMRVYGAFFLTFGALTVFLLLFRFLIDDATTEATILHPLICGFVLVGFSIPLFISPKPLWKISQEVPFFRFLFFDFFRLPHSSLHITKGIHPLVAIFFGALFSAYGYFLFSPTVAVLTLAGILILFCALSAPEMPFFLSLLLSPFFCLFPLGSHILSALLLLCLFAYLRKLLLGRRKASFSAYDVAVSIFGLLVLLSGIFGKTEGTLPSSIILFCFLLAYPLIGNLLTNRRLLSFAFGSLSIASLFPSLFTIAEVVLLRFPDFHFPDPTLDALVQNVLATYDVRFYTVFLLCAFFSALYFLHEKTSRLFRFWNNLSVVLALIALIVSFNAFAVFGLILAMLTIMVYSYAKKPAPYLMLLILMPFFLMIAVQIIPALSALLAGTELGFRFSSLSSLLPLLKDTVLIGLGIGSEEAVTAFSSAVSDVPYTVLYIPMMLEIGLWASIAFLLLLLIRPIHIRRFDIRYGNQKRDTGAVVATAAAFSVLVFGLFRFPFTELATFFPFFTVYALGSVSMSIYAEETNNRSDAYDFLSATTAATADILIRNP